MWSGLVVRILLMAVSNNWQWQSDLDEVVVTRQSSYDYIIDVPSVYAEGNASVFYPVVMMHGMNDAGHSGHIERMRKVVSGSLDGVYTTTVQIGRNVDEDEHNSVHMKMDDQVDEFAQIIAKDPNLRKGFNAIGFSQGALLIRGYIERYNDPPVIGFMSLHGPLAGIGSIPICDPRNIACRALHYLLGDIVYCKDIQNHLAQSNYYRDPTRLPEYLNQALFLPDINNERSTPNNTYKTNFKSLKQLIMVRALRDTTVVPNYSQWFGQYKEGGYDEVIPMNETSWYRKDSFGLQSLDRENKLFFYETPDDHLQFSDTLLAKWVSTHFRHGR